MDTTILVCVCVLMINCCNSYLTSTLISCSPSETTLVPKVCDVNKEILFQIHRFQGARGGEQTGRENSQDVFFQSEAENGDKDKEMERE